MKGSLKRDPLSLEMLSLAAFLVSAFAGLALSVFRKESRGLALASAALIFAFDLTLHGLTQNRGLRMLLIAWPMACAVWAHVAFLSARGRNVGPAGRQIGCALVLAAGLAVAATQHTRMVEYDVSDDADLAFVESLKHDDTKLLVVPWDLAFPYVHAHPPVNWSFLPADDATQALLADHYEIGTFLVPANQTRVPSHEALMRLGLTPAREVRYRDSSFSLYQ